MGQEAERQQRRKDFAGFQVNSQLMAAAGESTPVLQHSAAACGKY
jgi:ornithine carbamoyltransferase